jgi:hypothetical protein
MIAQARSAHGKESRCDEVATASSKSLTASAGAAERPATDAYPKYRSTMLTQSRKGAKMSHQAVMRMAHNAALKTALDDG